MKLKKIIKLFELGNVMVVGEKGSGKDMLTANVIARRHLPYVSNVEYKPKSKIPLDYYPLDFNKIDCGGNSYLDFVRGTVKPYVYPYPIGCDIYISDVGIYLPSQYCNELNKYFKDLPVLFAIIRHLADARIHCNCQAIGRIWDKAREQSRTYITCLRCKVIKLPFGLQLVFQKIRIYEKYQSCVDNVPALRLPFYLKFGKNRIFARLYNLNYEISHGKIQQGILVYFNKSDYDTHIFREILEKGSVSDA